MNRGFLATLGVVVTFVIGTALLADQWRMARATAVAEMTPAATSATTNSNLAAKSDRLKPGVQLTGTVDGPPAWR